MSFPVSEHFTRSRRHGTFYLACGEKDAALAGMARPEALGALAPGLENFWLIEVAT